MHLIKNLWLALEDLERGGQVAMPQLKTALVIDEAPECDSKGCRSSRLYIIRISALQMVTLKRHFTSTTGSRVDTFSPEIVVAHDKRD